MRNVDRLDLVQFALMTLAFLGLMFLGAFMHSYGSVPRSSNERVVRDLNDKYVQAFLESNVEWYRQVLSEDFVCIDSDGAVLHKNEFLEQAARGPDVAYYRLDEVKVRLYGDVALVQAAGRFIRADSSTGLNRYTDVYVRKGDDWKVVSAQITRGT